jgi:hypothetical protein
VWKAQGTPSGDGTVTATFGAAPTTAVIAVSRYSGVASVNPVGKVITGNSNGLNTGAFCSGGVDNNAYSFNFSIASKNTVVYSAVAMKGRTHTQGTGYTERAEVRQLAGSFTSSVAVEDKDIPLAGTVTVDGTFNGTVDWAMVALVIKPLPPQYTLTVATVGSGSVTLNPPGGTYNAGTEVALTATPNSGFVFSGWSGALSGSANPDTIQMNSNKNVTATFTPSGPAGEVVLEEVQTGVDSQSATISTDASLTAASGDLYLASISTKGRVNVSGVSGLGLTWTVVRKQCASRGTTMTEVWMAQGTPSGDGPVTATLPSSNLNSAIVVSRYSGVDGTNPIGNIISGNFNGLDGLCTGGTDNAIYSFSMNTTVSNSVVYVGVAIRDKNNAPGAGYTEHAQISIGLTGGSRVGLAVQDRTVASPSTVAVDGTISGLTDWAVVAVEIVPAPGASMASAHTAEETSVQPSAFQLERNYPNPFNPSTVIDFSLPATSQVKLSVYDLTGQLVRTLVSHEMPAGQHSVRWNGNDELNRIVAAGVYLYQMQAVDQSGNALFTQTRRMIFLK